MADTPKLMLTARSADEPEPDLTLTVVIHRAIRADLARLAGVLDVTCERGLEPGRARDFCRYTAAVLAAVRAHDDNEGAIVWPLVAATARQAVDLNPLTDDHEAIAAASDRAGHALAAFAAEPDARTAVVLRASVRELRDLLDEHIADEEAQLYPVMRRYLSAAAYRWCGKQIMRKGRLPGLRFTLPWLARHADDGERRQLLAAGGWRSRIVLAASRRGYGRLERRAFGVRLGRPGHAVSEGTQSHPR
jgi:Hemerythrin HHE cation binding domain